MKKINAVIISTIIFLSYLAILNPISAETLSVGVDKQYKSIQSAVVNASAGDVIEVYSGSYIEDLNVTTNNLEIRPASGESVTIKGKLFSDANSTVANIRINANKIKLHGFIIETPEVPDANYSGGIILTGTDIEIFNNKFISVGNGKCTAIQNYSDTNLSMGDISGLNIHDNIFQGNPAGGYIGVNINHTDSNYSLNPITVQKNVFTGNILYAILTDRNSTNILNNQITNTGTNTTENNGIIISGVDKRAQEEVNIHGNSIKNFNTVGILIDIDSQILKNINITNNLIQGNQIGIKNTSSTSGIKINNNTIINNVKYEIQNNDKHSLDARFNQWISNSGPIVSKISGNVNYYPWVRYDELPISSISKILKKNLAKKNNY